MKFIRLGGLSPVKYKNKEGGFQGHTAPSRHGIFAFPFPYIEEFLCLWNEKHIQEKKIKGYRTFEYQGEVWHHLNIDVNEEWTKSSMEEYKEFLRIVAHNDLKFTHETMGNSQAINPYKRGLGGCISKDHLEVFIDKADLGKVR